MCKTYKSEKEKEQERICQITTTIKHLKRMVEKYHEEDINTFLKKEINRLEKEKKELLKNGKGN